MILTLDEAIPYWKEAFSGLGEIRSLPGRNITKEAIAEADALVIRTVTRIDASLLEGSSVRFVASTSAGIDHIDLQYLQSRGIGFGHAPGSNATSVSEYISTALCVLAGRRGWNLKDKSIAVIGAGNVGSRVARKMQAFGMEVLLCDPPLGDTTGDPRYKNFEDVLQADILTFHVPLLREGAYPTFHMLNGEILNRLSPDQILVNSSRGPVFDNRALEAAVRERKIGGVILDVWEGEPQIDYSLLERIDIGTPHIAGSSLDGKIRATEMACKALHDFYRIPSPWNGDSLHSKLKLIRPEARQTEQETVLSVLLQAYDILKDDGDLRDLGSIASVVESNRSFDRLRSRYQYRPEFNHFAVDLNRQCIQLAGLFEDLGFQVRSSPVI